MTLARDIVLQPENSIDVEPDALTLYDMSRYKNNGTMVGAGNPDWVRLPSGLWVLDFNGTTSRIDCGTDPSLYLAWSFTIEVWFKTNTITGGFDAIVARGLAINFQRYLLSLANNTLAYIDGVAVRLVSGTVITTTDWFHGVVTLDAVAQRGNLYVNGTLANSAAIVNTVTVSAASILYLGYSQADAGNWFNGIIGPCHIYNYAKTAGQILNRYETTKHWFGIHD